MVVGVDWVEGWVGWRREDRDGQRELRKKKSGWLVSSLSADSCHLGNAAAEEVFPLPPTPTPSLSCFLSPRAKFLPCWSSCLSKSPCTQQPEAENEGGTLASAVRTIPSVLLAGESSAGVRSS